MQIRSILTVFCVLIGLTCVPASAQTSAAIAPGAGAVLVLGVRCGAIAQQRLTPRITAELDECLQKFTQHLSRLPADSRYEVATTVAYGYLPCFGLGDRKAPIVEQALTAARELKSFDLAIQALFNRAVCYWNDLPARFDKAMDNFKPFRNALAPYIDPSLVDTPQHLIRQAFVFRDMGRRYVRFLENTWSVPRARPLCGSGPINSCIADGWNLTQHLKGRLFHSKVLGVSISDDRSGELARLATSQYQLVQAQEAIRIGIGPFGLQISPDGVGSALAHVEQRLAEAYPRYNTLSHSFSPTIQQVEAALEPDEYYVSFLFSDADEVVDGKDRNVVAFKLSRNGGTLFKRLGVGNRELKRLAKEVVFGIIEGVPLDRIQPRLSYLGDVLIKGLDIPRGAKVILEVDEDLASLPFPLIVVDSQPLSVRNRIAYAASGGTFLRLRNRSTATGATQEYAGFGQIEFPGQNLPRLSAVGEEIRASAALFSPASLGHSTARESDIYEAADTIARAHILHFATHAVWSKGEFALLFRDGGGEDGRLTETDILSRIRTSADLVILSACDTARLSEESGLPGEAYSSLARAFFAVGARKVLVSQWKIDDRSASDFIIDFLRVYKEKGDARVALMNAQETMKNTPGKTEKDWAGWIIIGD